MTKGKMRKRLRMQFIKIHKKEVLLAIEGHDRRHAAGGPFGKMSEEELKLEELMRKKIGYSPRTNGCDMVWALIKLAKEIIEPKNEN